MKNEDHDEYDENFARGPKWGRAQERRILGKVRDERARPDRRDTRTFRGEVSL